MTQKEELYQKYEATMKFWIDKKSIDQHSLDASFDFFYSEIEQKDQQWLANNKLKEEAIKLYQEENQAFKDEEQTNKNLSLHCEDLEAKISHLQSTLEAADKVIIAIPKDYGEWDQSDDCLMADVIERDEKEFNEALEKYNQLKTKSQS